MPGLSRAAITTKNYSRYDHFDLKKYHRRGFSYFLYRIPGDRVILPTIQSIQNKRVLEVGIGSGYYTAHFLENGCQVVGVDINPHMGAHLNVPIIQATADDFAKHLKGETFDHVVSFWMTEYLAPQEFQAFGREAFQVLRQGGSVISTIVAPTGWGRFYQWASSLKHIEKFTYAKQAFVRLLEQENITIQDIPGRLGLPYAYLVHIPYPLL